MTSLPLPKALLEDLQAGRRPLTSSEKLRLGELLTAVELPFPEMYGVDEMINANRLWTSEHLELYLGHESYEYRPGSVNPDLAWIIGQAEPDGPIALDFRVSPPRVIYLGTIDGRSFWIELASTYERLKAAIRT